MFFLIMEIQSMECIRIQVGIIKLSPYMKKIKFTYQIWSLKSGFSRFCHTSFG